MDDEGLKNLEDNVEDAYEGKGTSVGTVSWNGKITAVSEGGNKPIYDGVSATPSDNFGHGGGIFKNVMTKIVCKTMEDQNLLKNSGNNTMFNVDIVKYYL